MNEKQNKPQTLDQKLSCLKTIIKKLGKTAIAFSGGVDSTFLLKTAADTLGTENVIAFIAKGPSLPQKQYDSALNLAASFSLTCKTIRTDELADENYTANSPDRCYVCKKNILKKITTQAASVGFQYVLSGHNLDDEAEARPGHKAEKEFNIVTPLAKAHLTKQDIRKASQLLDLPTALIPSTPCLATRIAFGLEITENRLKQVETAEDFIHSLGFHQLRVRHHNCIARIEVPAKDIPAIAAPPIASKIAQKLQTLGFKYVTIDLIPLRSGSMNPDVF